MSEAAVNKQLADKQRVAAENPNLLQTVRGSGCCGCLSGLFT